ncbi:MAG: hypothetical protein ACI4VF_05710 [Lachnospirales bacterium]
MENNNENFNENININEETNENLSEDKNKNRKIHIIIGCVLAVCAVIAVIIVVVIFGGLKSADIVDKIEVPAEPEEIQVGLTDYSATDAELSEIKDLNDVLEDYVDDNYDDMGLASSYGFLYSTKTKNNIMVRDLMSEGLVNPSENVMNNTDILFLKAEDVGLKGNDFVVCTAFNTKDGYYLSSDDLDGRYLTEQEYHDLVFRYSFAHGEPFNPKPGDENYKKITEVAGVADGYDIKHIVCDDKYAVVVGNSLKDTAHFVEAVLVKKGEDWTVGLGNVAQDKNAKQTANKSFPDMELGLMPVYNIGDYTNIMASIPEITAQLVELGMLQDTDLKNIYTCAAGSFAYVQTESGKRLLGVMNDEGTLDFVETTSLEQTIATMVHQHNDPPVFIIKFN